jgi:hypothetical protein
MISYNIGHLAFLNAKRYGISRVFFGGFFIRGHRYTMDVISYAIRFWSKGEMAAMFLRHEGFLGVMGAFLKGHPLQLLPGRDDAAPAEQAVAAKQLSAQFVERYPMGSPFSGGTIVGPLFSTVADKVTWVEKFVEVCASRYRLPPAMYLLPPCCPQLCAHTLRGLRGDWRPAAGGVGGRRGGTRRACGDAQPPQHAHPQRLP